MTSKKRLTDESIIAALIAKGSIKGAAASLHCTARTLYERMKKPDFKELYTQAKADILKTATAKLQGNLCGAIDTLAEITQDPEAPKQTRVLFTVMILISLSVNCISRFLTTDLQTKIRTAMN